MNFQEIARKLNISGNRVGQIYKQALKKLSHEKNKQKWEEIMDTIEAIKDERARQENLTQGERKCKK